MTIDHDYDHKVRWIGHSHSHWSSVKVTVEVEEVRFDKRVALAAVANGGSVTYVGHGLVGFALVVHKAGIHAAVVDEHIFPRQLKVSGGEAQCTPDFVAYNDLSGDRIGIAKQTVGAFYVARSKGIANFCGANRYIFNILCRNAFHLKVIFVHQVVEQTEIAHAVLAKMMVVAHHNVGWLDVVDDVVFNKNLRGRARKLLGEVDDDHIIDAELLKFLEFFLRRTEEAQVGAVDVEHLTRMWTKGDHNRLATNALRNRFHLVKDGLMAKMHTIEGAYGDHGMGNVAGFYDVSINLHL